MDGKYKDIQGLKLVYAWQVTEPSQTSFRCMAYVDALNILKRHEYSESRSWCESENYSVTRNVPIELKQSLSKFEVRSGGWFNILFKQAAPSNS